MVQWYVVPFGAFKTLPCYGEILYFVTVPDKAYVLTIGVGLDIGREEDQAAAAHVGVVGEDSPGEIHHTARPVDIHKMPDGDGQVEHDLPDVVHRFVQGEVDIPELQLCQGLGVAAQPPEVTRRVDAGYNKHQQQGQDYAQDIISLFLHRLIINDLRIY